MGKPRAANTQATNAIRTIRLMQGVHMRALAERVGRSAMWISLVERGLIKPGAAEAEKIGLALGVPVESLGLR